MNAADLDRQPVIVGVGQVTQRNPTWPDICSPLDLMEDAVRAADEDAGGGVVSRLDGIAMPRIFSWDHGHAPELLASRLGIPLGAFEYPTVGGNAPQMLMNRWVERMVSGDVDSFVLVGAEALAGKRAAKRSGHLVDWVVEKKNPLPPDTGAQPSHPSEMLHRAMLPILTYPLFEPALRTSAGRTLEEHTRYLGKLMAPFTEVAAKNTHAWFPTARTPEELVTVTNENRMISTPYTKYLNSVLEVSQAAAVLVTTATRAKELGIPPDQWVWFWGGADCNDVWYVTERQRYDASPGMKRCFDRAFELAGVSIDDVALFDLYSCFPSAVQLAQRALRLTDDDSRPLTVTGGLAYFGGPGNNYVTHSIGTMVRSLRERPGELGFVTANGWFVTKHSAGVYGSRPPTKPFRRVDPAEDQLVIDATPHPIIESDPNGTGVLDGYSVSYHKDNTPDTALAIIRLDSDPSCEPNHTRRAVAMSRDSDTIFALVSQECFGRWVRVRPAAPGPGSDFTLA